MHRGVLDRIQFICPSCRRSVPDGIVQFPLRLETVHFRERGHILEGILACTGKGCGRTYPIVEGVPIVLKDPRQCWHAARTGMGMEWGRSPGIQTYFKSLEREYGEALMGRSRLGATIECHYAALSQAPPLPTGFIDPGVFWHDLMSLLRSAGDPACGTSLDLGCSVGRMTGELSRSSRLAVGIDTDFHAVSFAARLYRRGRANWRRKIRGCRYQQERIDIDPRKNICFLLADALDPPFADSQFDLVVGMNLLDSIRLPLILLGQMDALLNDKGKLLIGSPYEWRPDICDPSEWLELQDLDSAEVVRRILRGRLFPETGFNYDILAEEDQLPWVFRNHDRFWSLFFVHVILAEKT